MDIKYLVESPWTNNGKGTRYNLTVVEIVETKTPVLTKTGLVGRGVACKVLLHTGRNLVGHAVWAPDAPEKCPYSFLKGAMLALERALAECKGMTREMRIAIWDGFHKIGVPQVEQQEDYEIW